jgi:CO dehydrogenase maturation factor
VLVVDSDESNSGLFRILGFDQPPVPLMELVGGKRKIQRGLKQTDVGEPLNVMQQDSIKVDDIPSGHILTQDNLQLVSIGKILQSLEGCACPMGVLSREFLKKLSLEKDEIAVVDMEAGIEHFGRGIETSLDSVLIVVEPSFESLQLAESISGLSSAIGIQNVWAVINKVPSDEIASKLDSELAKRRIDTIGCIHYDAEIFQSSFEGFSLANGGASKEMRDVFDSLMSRNTKA